MNKTKTKKKFSWLISLFGKTNFHFNEKSQGEGEEIINIFAESGYQEDVSPTWSCRLPSLGNKLSTFCAYKTVISEYISPGTVKMPATIPAAERNDAESEKNQKLKEDSETS